jgi:hypothetical protein
MSHFSIIFTFIAGVGLAACGGASFENYDGSGGYKAFADHWMSKKDSFKERGLEKEALKSKLQPIISKANIEVPISLGSVAATKITLLSDKTNACEMGGGGPGTGLICSVTLEIKSKMSWMDQLSIECLDKDGTLLPNGNFNLTSLYDVRIQEKVKHELPFVYGCFKQNGASFRIALSLSEY